MEHKAVQNQLLMKAQFAVCLFFNSFTGGRFLAILKPPPQTSGSRIQVRSGGFSGYEQSRRLLHQQ